MPLSAALLVTCRKHAVPCSPLPKSFYDLPSALVLIAAPYCACRELNLEFEIPFRELGFHGVPHRSTAFVMPTVNCLVELVESPATVIAMPAVAIVNLERVGFNLRNFDMVVVYKVCHVSACLSVRAVCCLCVCVCVCACVCASDIKSWLYAATISCMHMYCCLIFCMTITASTAIDLCYMKLASVRWSLSS